MNALERMRRHVEKEVHRDIFVERDGFSVLFVCRKCGFKVNLTRATILKSKEMLRLFLDEAAREGARQHFREVPPKDGSSWARVLCEDYL